MTGVPQNIDDDRIGQENSALELQPRSRSRRRFAVGAIKRAQDQLERASQVTASARGTLKQIGKAVDPREIAGGFAGLTAGEAAGGAVGGTAGAVVAGPPGAVLGAEIGAFTAGMLGMKLGMEAVEDLVEAGEARRETAQADPSEPAPVNRGKHLGGKVKERTGEIVGLASGATIGLVVAGPAGGLIGAVVGESVGGRVKDGLSRVIGEKEEPEQIDSPEAPETVAEQESVAQRLDRFGRNTVGESATFLVTGSVGAFFGATDMTVGHGIGRVVSKRVDWVKLARADDSQPDAKLPGGQDAAEAGADIVDVEHRLLEALDDDEVQL